MKRKITLKISIPMWLVQAIEDHYDDCTLEDVIPKIIEKGMLVINPDFLMRSKGSK